MEVKEAPNKIYVHEASAYELTKKLPYHVEYIRTDAFIEKAVKFMEKIDDIDEYSWYNEEEHAAGITEKCIEDFKKYMKGE